jgi:hypothetical protein
MSASRDILHDLAEIGATIQPAGDRLILRAGPKTIPARLVGRIRQAKAELLEVLGDHAASKPDLLAPPFKTPPSAKGEPGFEQPFAARRGRLEHRPDGLFLHFCNECGRWASFGYNVDLKAGRLGRWYCGEHRPRSAMARP